MSNLKAKLLSRDSGEAGKRKKRTQQASAACALVTPITVIHCRLPSTKKDAPRIECDFGTVTFATEAEVADFVAQRLHEETRGRHRHWLITRLQDLVAASGRDLLTRTVGQMSICAPVCIDLEQNDGEQEEHVRRMCELCERIRELARVKLAALKAAAVAAAVAAEAERSKDIKEFERLRVKLGVPPVLPSHFAKRARALDEDDDVMDRPMIGPPVAKKTRRSFLDDC